jgi:hypothetical protein
MHLIYNIPDHEFVILSVLIKATDIVYEQILSSVVDFNVHVELQSSFCLL